MGMQQWCLITAGTVVDEWGRLAQEQHWGGQRLQTDPWDAVVRPLCLVPGRTAAPSSGEYTRGDNSYLFTFHSTCNLIIALYLCGMYRYWGFCILGHHNFSGRGDNSSCWVVPMHCEALQAPGVAPAPKHQQSNWCHKRHCKLCSP